MREACEVLGVTPDADAEHVRRAYRRLARQCHPDLGGDASEFHRLQVAAETLLDDDRPLPPTNSSPSTSNMTRPSTASRVGGGGWGEAAGPRIHEGAVDVATVDWDSPIPTPPHPWDEDRLARALADEAATGPVPTVAGHSRGPGSTLNRVGRWLSRDLLTRFVVRPAVARGVTGHDVELRMFVPSGRTRRLADATSLPDGWTRHRRPNSTELSLVMAPSRDRRATALRAVDHLTDLLAALEWPLDQWHHLPPD